MNKLTIVAALFLASTAVAHAGNSISFQIDGQRVHIERPRHCASLDCLNIVTDKSTKATKTESAPTPAQQQAPVQATAPAAPAAPAAVAASPSVAPVPPAPPAPVAAAPAPAQVAAAAAPTQNSPIGVWATENNKGNVRVEQCGTNLCGYVEKTNDQVLINMKPDGAKWSGRVRDPRNDKKYDSTMAMKNPNALRVQGCAFGGMICGGETWKRVS